MDFFLLWIRTRIRERGWPRSEGFLRRRKFVAEEAIVAATQDAVRIAIAIGGSLPDIARAIAVSFVDTNGPMTRKDVEDWIEEASSRGEQKLYALSEIYPEWLRLCSHSASRREGDDLQHFLWTAAGDEYELRDPRLTEMYWISTALAGIAMSWALKHPRRAEDLFHNHDALASTEPELHELISASSTYSAWLHMAEDLVSRYSESVGFQRYEDLA